MSRFGGSCLGVSKNCNAHDEGGDYHPYAVSSVTNAGEQRQNTQLYPQLQSVASAQPYQNGVEVYYNEDVPPPAVMMKDDPSVYANQAYHHTDRYDKSITTDRGDRLFSADDHSHEVGSQYGESASSLVVGAHDRSATVVVGRGSGPSVVENTNGTANGEVANGSNVVVTTTTISSSGQTATADAGKRCRYEPLTFNNFKWIKQQHYAVVRDGLEYFDRYVVTYRLPNSNAQFDMFTHAEGVVHTGPIENKFPHLCGEVLSSHPLPAVNSLDNVSYYTEPSVDPNAPFHVQAEMCNTRDLTAVPLKVDTTHQVLVFRTYHDTLALQLMPTAFSERRLVSGTPLFHGVRKSICATVGTMFSDFHYAINGSPCVYALFPLGAKEKNDPGDVDRMRLIVLDRRDRVESEEWTATEAVLNSISDVALPVVQCVEGKQSRLDVRNVLYVGVVSGGLQITDAPHITKKYKTPRNAVVVVIDNHGVYATHVRDKEIVGQWVQKDAKVTYSILPRYYFDRPRSNVVRLNTADMDAKLKRSKTREMLI